VTNPVVIIPRQDAGRFRMRKLHLDAVETCSTCRLKSLEQRDLGKQHADVGGNFEHAPPYWNPIRVMALLCINDILRPMHGTAVGYGTDARRAHALCVLLQ
jgi:hypothetical protein